MFTAMLIAILIVAGAATVVGGGLVLAAQRRHALSAGDEPKLLGDGEAQPLLERTVHDLRVGDVIQLEGRDFLVEGVVHYDEDGHRWLAGRIVDDRQERWLLVGMERAGSGSVRLLEVDPDIDVGGHPPEALMVGESRYSLARRGNATARVVGDGGALGKRRPGTGIEQVTRCRWWRYEAAGDHCVVIEQWSSEIRALRGRELSAGEFEMMPGS